MSMCPTIERLRTLRPGEVAVYYKGHLPDDAARGARDAPSYSAVLGLIHSTARDLAAIGRLQLAQRVIERVVKSRDKAGVETERKIELTEYVAIGR